MSASALFLLSCRVQALAGIVPDQFQNGEARCAMYQHLRLYETGIAQGGEREDGFFYRALVLGQTDCLCCLQRPAPHEDAKRAKTPLLVLREQLITPGNGVLHGLLARWHVSGPSTNEIQTLGTP